MTSLRENIKKSLDDNLKKRDDIATATLRLILAAVKDSDIENRTKKKGDTISDQQILLLLQNMVQWYMNKKSFGRQYDSPSGSCFKLSPGSSKIFLVQH